MCGHAFGRGRHLPRFGAKGLTYIGPCRCGYGPHAYYIDESGRVIHASHIHNYVDPYGDKLSRIEDRLKNIEERLKKLEGGE